MEAIRLVFAKLNLKANYQIGLIDSKHILIHLHGEEDYHRIWIRSSWNVFRYPMLISKWYPDFTPDQESPIVPIWVSLPYLPAHLLEQSALISIANIVRTPTQTDTSTATLNRPSKARVCVEANISKQLPKRVWIGQGKTGFWQEFQYEYIPLYCNECHKLGHEDKKCIMANNEDIEDERIRRGHLQTDIKRTTQKKAVKEQQRNMTTQNKAVRQTYIQKDNKAGETFTPAPQPENKARELAAITNDKVSTQNRFSTLEIEEKQEESQKVKEKEQELPELMVDISTPKFPKAACKGNDQIRILKRGQYSLPESLKHLLKDTESFSKKVSKSLCVTDIDVPKIALIPSIQELRKFSETLKILPIREEDNNTKNAIDDGQDNVESEYMTEDTEEEEESQEKDFTKVVSRNKKKYEKIPDLQRSTRASTKNTQTNPINSIQ